MIPSTPDAIEATAERCRRLVRRRALMAAGVAVVPLPGVDFLTDVGVLTTLLPRINEEFGLSEAQIEKLAPERRVVVYKALSALGSVVVGRAVTRDLIIGMLRRMGVRMATKGTAKFVPLAGQALSAALTYGALRYVCEQHIRQCADVSRQLAQLPGPAAPLVERIESAATPARRSASKPSS